jgi:hypothetical protein
MTTALPSKSDTRAADGQVDLTLTLELEPDSTTALVRTLVVLHRRCCRVTEARYQSGIGGCDRLDLRVLAPPVHAHCVPAWLTALLEVRRVIAVPDHGRSIAHVSPASPDAARAMTAGRAIGGLGN